MATTQVTVVIPTLCGSKRAMELLRAIASVHAQQGLEAPGLEANILVVVNGSWVDEALFAKVSAMDRVRVLRLETPGISNARYRGRQHVETPYFLFLDDDDELYPTALAQLLASFDGADSDTALIVADAYNDYRDRNYGFLPSAEAIEADPLSALVEQNWLIVQSALFKTALSPEAIFDVKTASNECTMIAFNFVLLGLKVRVNRQVLALIHDKPDSESKTEHFITQETKVVEWMLAHEVPQPVRVMLQKKLAAAFHYNSTYYLERRMFRKSIAAHLQSLRTPGGACYVPYSRHILFGLFARGA